MSHTPDNTPAFPLYELNKAGDIGAQHFGMTLRDYFAAMAAQGDIAGLTLNLHSYDNDELALKARAAYRFADAMMGARK